MTDIKTLIIEAAHRRDLTYAQNFNGRAYALMDADWIRYFNTLDEVLKFLEISMEIDNTPTMIEADKGVLEKINEKQDSLRATCKAWDEATEKDGYVN